MDLVETIVREEVWDVRNYLHDLGLPLELLLNVRDAMQTEFNSAVGYHCKNKAGTYAYHEGVFALRSHLIGNNDEDWEYHFQSGLEGIFSPSRDTVVLISGVDRACHKVRPQPRSSKGAETEKASAQVDLFDDLPEVAPRPKTGTKTFWFMADEFGNAELSIPCVRNGSYIAFVERNFIAFAEDESDPEVVPVGDEEGSTGDFDPIVIRKK